MGKSRSTVGFLFGLWLVCLLFAIAISGMIWRSGLAFNRGCSGHLRRAASASTVPLAHKELAKATAWLREHERTEGSTAVIYDTPACDLGFWYENLYEAELELKEMIYKESYDKTQESNVLLKLRETLMDHEKEGESLTLPPNIALYPSHVLLRWGQIITYTLSVLGLIGFGAWAEMNK